MSRFFVLFTALASSACIGATPPLSGQWQHSDFLGMNQSSSACTWLSYKTRKIQLERAAGRDTFEGVYTVYEQAVWTLRGSDGCTFGRATISDALFQRARMWPVRLQRDGVNWRMIAVDAECTGDWCDEGSLFKKAFTTGIRFEGDALIDSGDGVAGNDALVFRTIAAVSSETNAAASRWSALLTTLNSGECNAFVSESVHPLSPIRQHQTDYCNLVRQIRSIEKRPIVGVSVLNSILIDRVILANGSPEKANDVLMIGSADYQDGSKAPRMTMLRKDRGSWKVFAEFGQ